MGETLDIITIGEGLIELSSDRSLKFSDKFDKYYGGAALTSAVVAQRLGSKVGFISRVGNDYFSEYLLDSWQTEGLDISQVRLSQGYNGVYFVGRADSGEYEFAAYRRKSAATKLTVSDISEAYIQQASLIYATGIAQSLSLSAREAVAHAFKTAKNHGIQAAYSPNFQQGLTTKEEAREWLEEIIEYLDIIFLDLKTDAIPLFELNDVDQIIKNLIDRGISVIVIKTCCGGHWIGTKSDTIFIPNHVDKQIDMTGSSDVYNGVFLHGMTKGMTIAEAGKLASITSGLQAQGMGAIKSIPDKSAIQNYLRENNV